LLNKNTDLKRQYGNEFTYNKLRLNLKKKIYFEDYSNEWKGNY